MLLEDPLLGAASEAGNSPDESGMDLRGPLVPRRTQKAIAITRLPAIATHITQQSHLTLHLISQQ